MESKDMHSIKNNIVINLLMSATVNIEDTSYEITTLNNEHYYLGHNPVKKIIVMEIFGYLTSVQFRELCDALLNLIIKTKIDKVLIDATHMPIIGLEDQHWLTETWLPKAVASGYGICAIVNSKYFFNRIAFDSIVNQLDRYRFKVKTFAHRSLAEHWLTNLESTSYLGTS